MIDKPLKSLLGKKFEGALAEPIDDGFFMPVRLDDPAWPIYLQAKAIKLQQLRLDKMPALARHLDINFADVEKIVAVTAPPPNAFALGLYYYLIAEKLASHLVPGFQEKPRGKHPREIVRAIREMADALKEAGKVGSDEEAAENFLKLEKPDLAKPHNQTELKKQVQSLCNRISQDRVKAERAEKALHKKPHLRIVGS
jgi:hypothetical protein